jgi:hypothetical protein
MSLQVLCHGPDEGVGAVQDVLLHDAQGVLVGHLVQRPCQAPESPDVVGILP